MKELVNNRYAIMKYAKSRLKKEMIQEELQKMALERKYEEAVMTYESEPSVKNRGKNESNKESGSSKDVSGQTTAVQSQTNIDKVQSEEHLVNAQ